MLMLISRVMSATLRVSTSRFVHTSLARSARSPGEWEPIVGGTRVSSGPMTSAMPASQAFHFGHASASFFDQRAISSYVRASSSS